MSSHATAVLKMPKRLGDVAPYAQSIINGVNKNPAFPAPTPTIAAVEADLAAFIAAQAIAETRAKGAADIRDAKLAQLRVDLEYMTAYVQLVADAAPPATASALIESAGLYVKKLGVHTKETLSLRPGDVSGTVLVDAKAVATRACYDWQLSTDQKTWTSLPSTLQSKTSVAALIPASIYFFRFRSVTKGGVGDWSAAVSIFTA